MDSITHRTFEPTHPDAIQRPSRRVKATDVAVKVFGDDMDKLSAITKEIAAVIEKVPGASEVETELRGTSPLLRVAPTEGALDRGISTRDVFETVAIALGGRETGFLYENVQRFPIIVRLGEKDRSDLNAIKSLSVGIAMNSTVPLKEVATVKFEQAYGAITREEGKCRAAVMINPRGRDMEGFVLEAQKAVAEVVELPPGYYTEWGGTFKNIYQTALIFICVPLALAGYVIGLIMNGLPFSISAGVGFIALTGIAVLNGVALVNYFNELHFQGVAGTRLIPEGTARRLRPVLMTALVHIFGFLPMMLSHGVGSEVQRPLASVVIGGIVSTTVLMLFVLPALYSVFQKSLTPVPLSTIEED